MNINNYFPTFRNLVVQEVEIENKTAGGIYIPSIVLEQKAPDEKWYKVIKTGKDCIEIKPGDKITLSRGIYPEPVGDYLQVMEQQVKGYEREA